MIRYYKELENPNDFYVPLIKRDNLLSKRVDNITLPMTFFTKYRNLFESFQSINILIKCISLETMGNDYDSVIGLEQLK